MVGHEYSSYVEGDPVHVKYLAEQTSTDFESQIRGKHHQMKPRGDDERAS